MSGRKQFFNAFLRCNMSLTHQSTKYHVIMISRYLMTYDMVRYIVMDLDIIIFCIKERSHCISWVSELKFLNIFKGFALLGEWRDWAFHISFYIDIETCNFASTIDGLQKFLRLSPYNLRIVEIYFFFNLIRNYKWRQ